MKPTAWRPGGLVGRIVAILLLTLLIEFAVSAILYQRASEFSIRDDEARRLAEHLVVSRKLLEERAPAARAAMAEELTTARYAVAWDPKLPEPIATADAAITRDEVIVWEPSLAGHDLRVRLVKQKRRTIVAGGLRLSDGSWLRFRTLQPVADHGQTYRRILLALIPAIGLMALGGLLVGRAMLPLRRLALAADRVGRGPDDAPEPVTENGPAEVRRLIAAFNRMQARIGRLIADRTQALAAVGHDIRTPLARLRLRAEAISAPDLRGAIAADIDEMEAMVASLLAFLRGDGEPEAPARVDLAVLCATLVDEAQDAGHDAEYDGPDHCERMLRRGAMKRALSNLVDNARHHAGWLRVKLADHGAAGIEIRVEDNGPGIPEDQLERVIEPFVRLDAARRRDTVGFGLGLSIVAQAIALEGGTFRLERRHYGGLAAVILLPATPLLPSRHTRQQTHSET